MEPQITHEMIAARAYELFVRRGYQHGGALEDWLSAEAELRAEMAPPEPLPPAQSQKAARSRTTRANKSTKKR